MVCLPPYHGLKSQPVTVELFLMALLFKYVIQIHQTKCHRSTQLHQLDQITPNLQGMFPKGSPKVSQKHKTSRESSLEVLLRFLKNNL